MAKGSAGRFDCEMYAVILPLTHPVAVYPKKERNKYSCYDHAGYGMDLAT